MQSKAVDSKVKAMTSDPLIFVEALVMCADGESNELWWWWWCLLLLPFSLAAVALLLC